jgi:protein TonB
MPAEAGIQFRRRDWTPAFAGVTDGSGIGAPPRAFDVEMSALEPSRSDRIAAVAGSALLQAVLGYALIVGLAPGLPRRVNDALQVFDILPAAPPPSRPKVVTRPKRAPKHAGAASPPNLRAKPAEIVVPPPIVPLVVPPPVIAAPKAGLGAAPSAGAAAVRGPGTGSGGQGAGSGSGGAGNGEGGGAAEPARWRKGRIRDSDYPAQAAREGMQGSLLTRYAIGTDGRVTGCAVIASSGNAMLDQTTCRLVMERYRYYPARDAQGRTVPDSVTEDHTWELDEAQPEGAR